MAIAIFSSLQGENLEDFSVRLFERWRLGHKGRDDGVLLVVFVLDRRVRLEIGYGLEAVIPDAEAARIIREEIAPRFREGRYVEGLEAAVDAVFERIEPPGSWTQFRRGLRGLSWPSGPEWVFLVVGLFFAVIILSAIVRLVLGLVNRVRALFDYPPVGTWILRYLPEPDNSSGSGSSSGGSFSGGGSSGGGGGSSGGGFSGGGGSSGGGGASGSW